MNRIQYLQQALEINEVQADLLNASISDIPDNKLKEFLIFRMNYVQPMMSKELITKTALFDFRKKMIEARLRGGEQVFGTIYEVKEFIQTFYKGKEVVNGAANYFDFVVIGLDKDGELINKYAQNEHGTYKKLSSEESGRVYQWCLENQNKIGLVKYVPYYDPDEAKQLEHQKVLELENKSNNEEIDPKIMAMMGNLTKKVQVGA
jgi:hypothetical protein